MIDARQGHGCWGTKWVMTAKRRSRWLRLSKGCLSPPSGREEHEQTAKVIKPVLREGCSGRQLDGCDRVSLHHTRADCPKWLPTETCHPDLIRTEQHEGAHTGQLERNHMEAGSHLPAEAVYETPPRRLIFLSKCLSKLCRPKKRYTRL